MSAEPRRLMVIMAADYDSAQAKGVEHLFRQHDEMGFFEKVFLISPYMRRDRRVQLDDRHELIETGFHTPHAVRSLIAPFHLARLIASCVALVRRERVQLVRATEPTLCGFIAWAVSRIAHVPYCVSLHADYDRLFVLDGRRGAPTLFGSRALIRPLERLTLRHAARVMPIRDSLIPYVLRRGVPPDRVRVIPHGIDMAPFTREPELDIHAVLQIPPTTAIVAFAGRLSPENYIADMLDAVRIVALRREDFVLVVAGGGVLERDVADRLACDPVLRRVVRPIGFVTPPVVRALRASCAVSLCLMGGFSLIEACAAGRPVIAFDVDWHHELVIDGRTGRLIAEHGVEDVAAAIEFFLDHPADAARMGREARTLAFARHDIRQAADTRRRWYAEVLNA